MGLRLSQKLFNIETAQYEALKNLSKFTGRGMSALAREALHMLFQKYGIPCAPPRLTSHSLPVGYVAESERIAKDDVVPSPQEGGDLRVRPPGSDTRSTPGGVPISGPPPIIPVPDSAGYTGERSSFPKPTFPPPTGGSESVPPLPPPPYPFG